MRIFGSSNLCPAETAFFHERTPRTQFWYFVGQSSSPCARVFSLFWLIPLLAAVLFPIATFSADDTIPPAVTSVNFANGGETHLITEGSTYQAVLDRWSVGFSEELAPATVNDPNNFDLRAAGPDEVFDTPDDVRYIFASNGYSSGLTSSHRILNGPLQPGRYRFTATSGLTDLAGNSLSPLFVRN